MATGVLSLFAWNFPLFSNSSNSSSSSQTPPIFALNRISLLGNPLGDVPNVIAVGVKFYLKNERFAARFPPVNLTVSYQAMPILAIRALPLTLTPGVKTYSAEIQIFSMNPSQVQRIVDDSWTGADVTFTVLGPPEFADYNIVQKVWISLSVVSVH